MRFSIAKSTGEPSPEFIEDLQSAHVATASKYKPQAILLQRILGISPEA